MAADYSLVGFGTLGYAISDIKTPYLRYISNKGTFREDSLLGVQVDIQLSPEWGATAQVVGSAPRGTDNGYETSVRWAFMSYRPANEWLFRVGRLRPPVLNHTQNGEVGVTYDVARLPAEVYSLSPVYDIDGLAITKRGIGESESLTLDLYAGYSRILQKTPFQRDPTQTFVPDRYFPESLKFVGIVLSKATENGGIRLGVHSAQIRPRSGRQFVEDPAATEIPLPAPLGGILFVPGAPTRSVGVLALTAAGDWTVGPWRASLEYARRVARGTNMGPASSSLTGTVYYPIERWQPYLGFAGARPGIAVKKYFQQLNAAPVPLVAQLAPLSIGATYHQSLADAIYIFDQRSLMVGTSYRVSPNGLLKFELMRTKVGIRSVLIDGDFHNRRFNVLSMSYNFTF